MPSFPKPVLVLAAALALGSTAAASATPPALSERTVMHAPTKSPIDVAGNHLHQGQRIRKGTALVRWKVTITDDTATPITISAPRGWTLGGLGLQDPGKLGFAVVGKYHRSYVKIRVFQIDPPAASAHIYALIKK